MGLVFFLFLKIQVHYYLVVDFNILNNKKIGSCVVFLKGLSCNLVLFRLFIIFALLKLLELNFLLFFSLYLQIYDGWFRRLFEIPTETLEILNRALAI